MADKLDNLEDDEILYEEEVLHEEIIDPSEGNEDMGDDMGDGMWSLFSLLVSKHNSS